MNYQKLSAISTAVMTFATVLGVMFAFIYYLNTTTNISTLETILWAIIYIDIILMFLYTLTRNN